MCMNPISNSKVGYHLLPIIQRNQSSAIRIYDSIDSNTIIVYNYGILLYYGSFTTEKLIRLDFFKI